MTPGLICVWANLPEDEQTVGWYEENYIPLMRERNASYALHSELMKSGFEGEPIGQLDAPWPLCTIYEISNIEAATNGLYDKANHPSDDLRSGTLSQARFDVRTYKELRKWQSEDWDEGMRRHDPLQCTILTQHRPRRYCEHICNGMALSTGQAK